MTEEDLYAGNANAVHGPATTVNTQILDVAEHRCWRRALLVWKLEYANLKVPTTTTP